MSDPDLTTPALSADFAMLALFSAALIAVLNIVGQRFSVELIPGALRRVALPWFVTLVTILLVTLLLPLSPLSSQLAHVVAPVMLVIVSMLVAIRGAYAMWHLSVDSERLASLMLRLPAERRSAAARSLLHRVISNSDPDNVRRLLSYLASAERLELAPESQKPNYVQRLWKRIISWVRRLIRQPRKAHMRITIGYRAGEPLLISDYTGALAWICSNSKLAESQWLVEELVFSLVGDWRLHRYQLRAFELFQFGEISAGGGRADGLRQIEEEFVALMNAREVPLFDALRAQHVRTALPRLLAACREASSHYWWDPVGFGFMGAIAMTSRWSGSQQQVLTTLLYAFSSVYSQPDRDGLGSDMGMGHFLMFTLTTQAMPLALRQIRERIKTSLEHEAIDLPEIDYFWNAVAYGLVITEGRVLLLDFCRKELFREGLDLITYRHLASSFERLLETEVNNRGMVRDLATNLVRAAVDSRHAQDVSSLQSALAKAKD